MLCYGHKLSETRHKSVYGACRQFMFIMPQDFQPLKTTINTWTISTAEHELSFSTTKIINNTNITICDVRYSLPLKANICLMLMHIVGPPVRTFNRECCLKHYLLQCYWIKIIRLVQPMQQHVNIKTFGKCFEGMFTYWKSIFVSGRFLFSESIIEFISENVAYNSIIFLSNPKMCYVYLKTTIASQRTTNQNMSLCKSTDQSTFPLKFINQI
jgi:hypothetical protein